MKITCTEDEKAELVYELAVYSVENDTCLFMTTRRKCIGKLNCSQCLRDNIEWEITESQPWWKNERIFKEG